MTRPVGRGLVRQSHTMSGRSGPGRTHSERTPMSDPNDTEQAETGQETESGPPAAEPVKGVDTDPADGKKSIAVDTTERLESKDDAPDFDEIPDEELESERQKRLDPENRPDNVEIDNSKRTFNPETGLFEDSEVEPPEGAPFATTEAEQSNSGSDDSDESEDTES